LLAMMSTTVGGANDYWQSQVISESINSPVSSRSSTEVLG
jgi:hypothetical protein